MKKNYFIFLCLLCFYTSFGQRFNTPSSGKAIICFACVTYDPILGDIYHNDKYIGEINYPYYSLHEVDSGNHLFWIEQRNNVAAGHFIEADLEEGKIYVLLISSISSFAVHNLDRKLILKPLDISDTLEYKRVKRLFKYVNPTILSQKELDKKNNKHATFIEKSLRKYQNFKEMGETEKIGVLLPDEYIPIEFLNN